MMGTVTTMSREAGTAEITGAGGWPEAETVGFGAAGSAAGATELPRSIRVASDRRSAVTIRGVSGSAAYSYTGL